MSLQKPKAVHTAASKLQYTAAGREVQVDWRDINEWPKAEQGEWYTDW